MDLFPNLFVGAKIKMLTYDKYAPLFIFTPPRPWKKSLIFTLKIDLFPDLFVPTGYLRLLLL